MSAVSSTNATVTSGGLVIYEFEGVLRALLGSVIPAATIDGLITSAQIEEIEAAKITGTISETQIGPEAVSTPKLKAGSVATATLAAGAVTAAKIAVAQLSAISANVGTLTAGIIQGPTIRTSASEETVIDLNGIRLTAGSATLPGVKQRIDWEKEAGSSVAVASIYGRYVTTKGPSCYIVIRAASPTKGLTSSLNLTASDNAETLGSANLVVHAQSRLLLDQEGRSEFLGVVAALGNHKVDFGAGEVVFTASAESALKEVNHGLGVTPSSVMVTGSGFFAIYFVAGEANNTRFKVRGFSPGGAFSGNRPFTWLAIA